MLLLEQEIRQMKLEKLRRLNGNKHEYYTPIGKVEEFIDKFASGKYLINGLFAANGVGKTAVIVNIVRAICYGSNNPYFQHEMFQNFPYLKKGRIVSDPTTIKEAIIPALREWFPEGRYTTHNEGKNYEYKWITDTGFEFDLMTFEQSVKEFESANLGFVLLDEPPPEAIYKACVSRLRKGGVMAILCTPLTGSAWLYDEFAAKSVQDLKKEYKSVTIANVEDACKAHGVRGFLEHSQILRMIAQYDDEDRQARIFGKFQHLTGLVFKKWNREVHVIKPFKIDKKNFTVYEALDTHPRNPDAYVQIAVDRYGTCYVIYEHYKNNTDEELVHNIKLAREDIRIEKSLLEPAAFNEDQHNTNETENSLYKRLYKLGLTNFVAGSKRRDDATRIIKDFLNFQETRGKVVVPPKLYVFDTCPRLIWEIEHYQWDDWRGKTAETKNPREKPMDKDDHEIECVGRILLEEPMFVPYIEDKQRSRGTQPSLDPYD